MIKRRRTSRARSTTRALALIAFVATLAVVAAGCGGDSDSSASDTTTASGEPCDASIGVLTVLTGAAGPQGREMLHWAQLAVDQFNEENGTDIKVVEGDDQLDPAQAATIAQQWVSDDKIVAVVGPESDSTVESAGPIFGQPGMAMVSSTATSSRLTEGKYPTFYRVTPPDSLQGSQDAQYMIDNLEAKKVFVIDDQSAYSKGIADVVVPLLEDAGVDVSRDSVSQTNTDYSALVSKIADDTDVVFLPWMLAANAQLFGDQMAEQSKTATIFGTDGVFSPQDFKVEGSVPVLVLARRPEQPELRRPRAGVRGSVRAVRRVRAHDLSGDPGRARCGQAGLRRRRRHGRSRRRRGGREEHGHLGLDPRPDLVRGRTAR